MDEPAFLESVRNTRTHDARAGRDDIAEARQWHVSQQYVRSKRLCRNGQGSTVQAHDSTLKHETRKHVTRKRKNPLTRISGFP
jgi:hypothetical protein